MSKADNRKQSKAVNRKQPVENAGTLKFLNDLESISKALHPDKTHPRGTISTVSSRSKSVGKSHLPEPKTKLKDASKNSKDSFDKDKKSIWSWKGIKALTHVRNRRFNCRFYVQVHSIEGLPSFFDDVSLIVHWKRRDGGLVTRPVRVCGGTAEFEEQLSHSCSVYGSRSGPHHSAKYEAKHFLLYASVYNAPELDLGKHRVDLTRLLPLTLEELEEEKSSGKWTTSFRLSGKARGGTMNVSFGYAVIGNNSTESSSNNYVSAPQGLLRNRSSATKLLMQFDQMDELSIRQTGSLPARSSTSNLSAEDTKDLHEVLPISRSELSDSVNMLYQKLDEEMSNASVINKLETLPFSEPAEPLKLDLSKPPDIEKGSPETECKIGEYSVIEQGIEEFTKEKVESEDVRLKAVQDSVGKSLETNSNVDLSIGSSVEEINCQKDEPLVSDCNFKENESTKESLMKELELALTCTSDLMKEGLESQEDECNISDQESYSETKSKYRNLRKARSLSLDDITESVANEFLDMLGIDQSPLGLSSESETESPRERLLRQFEKDCLASGSSFLDFDVENNTVENAPTASGWETISDDFHNLVMAQDYEDRPKIDTEAMRVKIRASMLEDLETEALMREWGLNDRAFQHSPPRSSGGFGSPIDAFPQNPQQLPPLAEGLGPFVQTKNGGFLRSMNPVLFKNAKNSGSLIMQASSPVVVPAEMGSSIMDILQGLASVGIEKLSMQANRLMPLEDITGKSVQQIAWEAAPSLEGPERQGFLQHEYEIMQKVSGEQKTIKETTFGARSSKFESNSLGSDAEYVSLEDLAPLAMDKIEALSIEGLRIQSGMSDEDAPSNISPQNIGEFSALKGKTDSVSGSIGLDGTAGLRLLDVKDNGEDLDGLMGLSLTLDEWMKLDSGEIDDEDLLSERTSKILAAHHATSLELFHGRSKGEKRRGKSRKCGFLGNNFTVALMVQLRDPLRNYEPVGTPMLALIQVERVFVAPKPKIYSTVPQLRNCNDDEEEEEGPKAAKKEDITEEPKEDKILEELIPQFKVTEVHVAGLKTETGKKKLWCSSNQQSGSRWLLANGMGKKNKHPLMKSKAVTKASAPASSSPVTTTVNPGETLWSISSRVHGTGAKWKELAALNPHIRNPNVIFPNETIRLR